jgi:hypothetical protein
MCSALNIYILCAQVIQNPASTYSFQLYHTFLTNELLQRLSGIEAIMQFIVIKLLLRIWDIYKQSLGWGYSSVVEYLPSMCTALRLVFCTTKQKHKQGLFQNCFCCV